MGHSLIKTPKQVVSFLVLFLFLACSHKQDHESTGCSKEKDEKYNLVEAAGSAVLVTGTARSGDEKLGEWYGSGAIVAHHEKWGTAVLSAAHVCVPDSLNSVPPSEPPIEWDLHIADKNEKIHTAFAAFVAKNFDACIIHIPLVDSGNLNISATAAPLGEPVINISSPFAIFSKDVSLIFSGYYSGNLKIDGAHEMSTFTVPSGPGASGSPVLDSKGEIVGIVSRVNGQFHHVLLSPTHKELKSLFEGKADVDPVTFTH